MRSFTFNSKKLLIFLMVAFSVYLPVEISLRGWYPYERRENELIDLGEKIRTAPQMDIGLFGNSTVRMLDSEFIENILRDNSIDKNVENYCVSGLSGIHVLTTMLELQRLPKISILPIAFRDSDFNDNSLNKAKMAIYAGARLFTWDAFTFYVEYKLTTALSTLVFSLGNFPPQSFIAQSAREMLNLKPVDAYRSLFGYHFTHAKKENNLAKQYEYGKMIYKTCLTRQQPLGREYLEKFTSTCMKVLPHSRIIIIRMPMDEESADLEERLYQDCFTRLKAFCESTDTPYYDFNQDKYPHFPTKDGAHLTKSARKRFIQVLVQEFLQSSYL
ncbi:hypothetical protein JXA70_09705 [candidate division KSB1 bacterium]|nr:hypothetical protein [candidate division KSB1 bacterium]